MAVGGGVGVGSGGNSSGVDLQAPSASVLAAIRIMADWRFKSDIFNAPFIDLRMIIAGGGLVNGIRANSPIERTVISG